MKSNEGDKATNKFGQDISRVRVIKIPWFVSGWG